MDPEQGQGFDIAGLDERSGVDRFKSERFGQLAGSLFGERVVRANEHGRRMIAVPGVGEGACADGVETLDDVGMRRPTGDFLGGGSGMADGQTAEIGEDRIGAVDQDFSGQVTGLPKDPFGGFPGNRGEDRVPVGRGGGEAAKAGLESGGVGEAAGFGAVGIANAEQDIMTGLGPEPAERSPHVSSAQDSDFHGLFRFRLNGQKERFDVTRRNLFPHYVSKS